MSGICGIAFAENMNQQTFKCLTPMLRALDPLKQKNGLIHVSDSIGLAVQEFPGRLSGIAQEKHSHGESVFGFHGNIYNLSEVLYSESDCHDPLQGMLRLSLRDIESFLKSLRGEFVCALWHAPQGRLYVASDRFRVHPVFFTHDSHKIVFSSRMKGLLSCPYSQDPDHKSWGYY